MNICNCITESLWWQPTPVFLPGAFHGQRSLAGDSPWSRRVVCDWTRMVTYTHIRPKLTQHCKATIPQYKLKIKLKKVRKWIISHNSWDLAPLQSEHNSELGVILWPMTSGRPLAFTEGPSPRAPACLGKPAEGGGPGVGIRDGGEDSTGCSLFSRRRRAFKLV